MALNHVLIAPEYSRRRELQESYLNIFYLPIFDRFMAHQSSKKNFGPNVIYCFLGYVWYVCIACIYCMYGMYVSYVFIVCVDHMCITCVSHVYEQPVNEQFVNEQVVNEQLVNEQLVNE